MEKVYSYNILLPFLFVSSLVFVMFSVSCGTFDSCHQLAERICRCQPTLAERDQCRAERVSTRDRQWNIFEDSPGDNELCSAALETCTCEALDKNETELCAFVPKGGALKDIQGEPQEIEMTEE